MCTHIHPHGYKNTTHRWLAFLERNTTRVDAVRVLAMLPERTTPLQVLAPYLAKV